MNDSNIIKKIASKTSLSQKKVREIIDSLMSSIIDAADEGEKISIPHFGTFLPVERKERMGYDFKGKKKIKLPYSKTVKFKVSSSFKKILEEPIAEQQLQEKKEWLEKKQKEKFIAFDSSNDNKQEVDTQIKEQDVKTDLALNKHKTFSFMNIFKENRIVLLFFLLLAGFVIFKVIMEKSFQHKITMLQEQNRIETEKRIKEEIERLTQNTIKTQALLISEIERLKEENRKLAEEKVIRSVKKEFFKKHPLKKSPLIKVIRYRVRKNDNLWNISKIRSGNPYNWVGIYSINGKKISNPNLIYPGQEILIPVVVSY